MYYSQPITLNTQIGNNTFAYDERMKLFGKAEIVLPQLIEGAIDDVQLGDHVVFAEMMDREVQEFRGLARLVCLDYVSEDHSMGKKVYVMDNHNHALYCWYKEVLAGRIYRGLSLIHIDQHSDMKNPVAWLDIHKENDLDYVTEYTNEVCTIADFIQPALKTGIISQCIQVRTENGLLDYDIPKFSYIVDVDIDFWATEMGIEEFDRTIQKTRQLIAGASMVTIATSPCFIDQERAVEIVKLLLS